MASPVVLEEMLRRILVLFVIRGVYSAKATFTFSIQLASIESNFVDG